MAAIDTTTLLGLRDRGLIALMSYTFARVGAATGMRVEDHYVQKRRGWVRLHEKGGKVNELPCQHNLEQYLEEWLAVSGLAAHPDAPLFPALKYGRLADDPRPLPPANVHLMIQRRAKAAGLRTKISAHSFRATGITTYLQNGGKLEIAQAMAGHESARTTGLYDRRHGIRSRSMKLRGSCIENSLSRSVPSLQHVRRGDKISFSEMERVGFEEHFSRRVGSDES